MKIRKILIAFIANCLTCGSLIIKDPGKPIDPEEAKRSVMVHDALKMGIVNPMPYVLSKLQQALNEGLERFLRDQNNIKTLELLEEFGKKFGALHIKFKAAVTASSEKYSTAKANLVKEELEKLVRGLQAHFKHGQGWDNFMEYMKRYIDVTDPLNRAPVIDPGLLDLLYYRLEDNALRRGGVHGFKPPGVSGIFLHNLGKQGVDGCSTDEEEERDINTLDHYLGMILAFSEKAFMPGAECEQWAPKFAASIEKSKAYIARTNEEAGGKAIDPASLNALVTPPVTCVVNYDDKRRLDALKAKTIGSHSIEEIQRDKQEIEQLECSNGFQLRTTLVPPLLFAPFIRDRSTHDMNAENYWLLANTICKLLSNGHEKVKPVGSYKHLSENLEEFRESFNAAKILSLLEKMEEQYIDHESKELKASMRHSVRLFLAFLANCPFLCLYKINNGVDVRRFVSKLIRFPYTEIVNVPTFVKLHNNIVELKMSYEALLKTREFSILVNNNEECNPTAFDTLEADRIQICKAISDWLNKSEFGAGSYSKEEEVKICDAFVKNAENIMPFYEDYAQRCVITPSSVFAEEQAAEVAEMPAQE